MVDFDSSQIKATFKKISAWGRAIESGQDGVSELAVLQTINQESPALLAQAVDYAEMCQNIASDSEAVPRTDPSHPVQRLARIQVLKEILWPDEQSSPEVM